jgi:hypothetical protein
LLGTTIAVCSTVVSAPSIRGGAHFARVPDMLWRGGRRIEGGDYPVTVRLLVDAGETFEPSILPTGRDDVDAVLREHLRRPPQMDAR